MTSFCLGTLRFNESDKVVSDSSLRASSPSRQHTCYPPIHSRKEAICKHTVILHILCNIKQHAGWTRHSPASRCLAAAVSPSISRSGRCACMRCSLCGEGGKKIQCSLMHVRFSVITERPCYITNSSFSCLLSSHPLPLTPALLLPLAHGDDFWH